MTRAISAVTIVSGVLKELLFVMRLSVLPVNEKPRSQIKLIPNGLLDSVALSPPHSPEDGGVSFLIDFNFDIKNHNTVFCAHPNRPDQAQHSFLFGGLKKCSNIYNDLITV